MAISIEMYNGRIAVRSPYNTKFMAGAKKLGGRWEPPAWTFDMRNEALVRQLCVDVYGTDGVVPADVVSVRVSFSSWESRWHSPIEIFGRTIASASGRDSGARLGDDVALLSGGFTSGGSVKNWGTSVKKEGATVLLHDVPRAAAQEYVDHPVSGVVVEILESNPPVTPEASALMTERARLVARLAEIDELLGSAAASA